MATTSANTWFEQNSLIDFVKIKCFHNSLCYRSAVIQSFTKTVSKKEEEEEEFEKRIYLKTRLPLLKSGRAGLLRRRVRRGVCSDV